MFGVSLPSSLSVSYTCLPYNVHYTAAILYASARYIIARVSSMCFHTESVAVKSVVCQSDSHTFDLTATIFCARQAIRTDPCNKS